MHPSHVTRRCSWWNHPILTYQLIQLINPCNSEQLIVNCNFCVPIAPSVPTNLPSTILQIFYVAMTTLVLYLLPIPRNASISNDVVLWRCVTLVLSDDIIIVATGVLVLVPGWHTVHDCACGRQLHHLVHIRLDQTQGASQHPLRWVEL